VLATVGVRREIGWWTRNLAPAKLSDDWVDFGFCWNFWDCGSIVLI
jgi:hypothetical protein